jgi:hypothetical protein
MIIHMKPRDAAHGFPRLRANASNRTSSLPLRYSVSRAVPGQSRRHAVRSSLDPLSRGPLLHKPIPMPSGILILWLRCKIGWRSRQYCEGPWEGFPSAPKVWRPLDVSNLPERLLRSSQSWEWPGLNQAGCRFCTTRRASLSLRIAAHARFFLPHRKTRQ